MKDEGSSEHSEVWKIFFDCWDQKLKLLHHKSISFSFIVCMYINIFLPLTTQNLSKSTNDRPLPQPIPAPTGRLTCRSNNRAVSATTEWFDSTALRTVPCGRAACVFVCTLRSFIFERYFSHVSHTCTPKLWLTSISEPFLWSILFPTPSWHYLNCFVTFILQSYIWIWQCIETVDTDPLILPNMIS